MFCAVTALTLVVGKVSVEVGDIDWEKTSLVDAYQNYGFAYGFTYTFADFGISRPSGVFRGAGGGDRRRRHRAHRRARAGSGGAP